MPTKPIAVDLFAGGGGLSLGLELAGFEIAAAVERQPEHAKTHALNFPQCPVLGDIHQVTGDHLNHLINQEITLLAGGPPCQGFSIEGKRRIDDERSLLVWQYVRLLEEILPPYFLFENVTALATQKFQPLLYDLLRRFTALGYQTTFKVVNAKSFGVPQNRDRLIIIGSRTGKLPYFPLPLTNTPTVWDAICDLPEPESYIDDQLNVSLFKIPSLYGASLRELRNLELVSGFLKTRHAIGVQERFLAATPGKKERISRFHKLDPNGLSCTLKAGTTEDRGSHTAARPIHPFSPRVITVREAARLHSFPDWFRFHPSKHWGFMQVGNSVPPLMAKAIAQEILALL